MRRQVELLEKNKPRQERAKRTYESILAAAAELLIEVGVERISTNLVAERAGITVPALYRYFPNKYAVLNALGASLMDRQNAVFEQWFERNIGEGGVEPLMRSVDELLRQTLEVTRDTPAGLEIVQALRAVGPLQEVRLESHRVVAGQFAAIAAELFGRPADAVMRNAARVSVDVGYAIVEMALEDETLDHEAVIGEGARMIRAYWGDIVSGSER